MSKVSLDNIRIPGRNILIERERRPSTAGAAGDFAVPDSYVKNPKDDVEAMAQQVPFLDKGRIVVVGDEVPEGRFNVGDVVHYQPNMYFPCYLDKADPDMLDSFSPIQTPYVLLDYNSVDFVEV